MKREKRNNGKELKKNQEKDPQNNGIRTQKYSTKKTNNSKL